MIFAMPVRYGDGEYCKTYYMVEYNHDMLLNNGQNIYLVADKRMVEDAVNKCDVLFVPGGLDINPKRYNEENTGTKEFLDEIDELDYALIDAFYKAGKPIIGICRGHQIINVFFGGTLYQDIADHDDVFHNVTLKKGGFVDKIYNCETLRVNSYHHQNIKDVAPGFEVVAVSEDGYVEAIQKDNIYSVQWHPEMYDADTYFKGLLEKVLK
ncbi:MAG: gamma-glutamyl-gamma-aminobutyrate hydrolase family protein [Erysipelotrichaceae bacterium]|nr:gamma-glutamyl-gamma-aminobutyrate hydrolase family protein [Erysipelotrichaceae bacterium]